MTQSLRILEELKKHYLNRAAMEDTHAATLYYAKADAIDVAIRKIKESELVAAY